MWGDSSSHNCPLRMVGAGKDSCDGLQEEASARDRCGGQQLHVDVEGQHVLGVSGPGTRRCSGGRVAEACGAPSLRDSFFRNSRGFYGLEFQLLHGAVWP